MGLAFDQVKPVLSLHGQRKLGRAALVPYLNPPDH
jgi:hypothetical protein